MFPPVCLHFCCIHQHLRFIWDSCTVCINNSLKVGSNQLFQLVDELFWQGFVKDQGDMNVENWASLDENLGIYSLCTNTIQLVYEICRTCTQIKMDTKKNKEKHKIQPNTLWDKKDTFVHILGRGCNLDPINQILSKFGGEVEKSTQDPCEFSVFSTLGGNSIWPQTSQTKPVYLPSKSLWWFMFSWDGPIIDWVWNQTTFFQFMSIPSGEYPYNL